MFFFSQAPGCDHVLVKHIITGGAVDQQRNAIKDSEADSLQLINTHTLHLPKEGDAVLAIDGSNSQKQLYNIYIYIYIYIYV
jgi:hypothetical protein